VLCTLTRDKRAILFGNNGKNLSVSEVSATDLGEESLDLSFTKNL